MPTKIEFLLSIDAGATSTKAGIFGTKNQKEYQKLKGEGLYFLENKKQGLANLHKIVKEIHHPNQIKYVVLGLAGADTDREIKAASLLYKKFFKRFLPSVKNVLVVNDIALLAKKVKGLQIALIAGTGTNCVGFVNGKIVCKSGGLGHILSDQGSGYYIGLKALQKTVESADKRGKTTLLESKILDFYQINSISELKAVVYSKTYTKSDFGRLVPLVVKCATENDYISNEILLSSSKKLFAHVKGVLTQCNVSQSSYLLTCSGSIFKIPLVREEFEKHVVKYNVPANIVYNKKPAYLGGLEVYK